MFEKPRVVSNLEFQENWELSVNIYNRKKPEIVYEFWKFPNIV